MRELYPLKFKPILKDKIWGGEKLRKLPGKAGASMKCGESWEISSYQDEISIVSEGFLEGNDLQELIEVYMGDLVGDSVFDRFGIEFPLLIKFIDTSDILSIQVHPDDAVAFEKHGGNGKTEMWYILEADKDASLISGFSRDISHEEFVQSIKSGDLTEILNYESVKKGDVFFMPAGRVHAIGSGILLTEIQQTSDLTYRIFDFNRMGDNGEPRELHIDLALDVIDFKSHDNYRTDYEAVANKTVPAVSCPYFTTNVLKINQPVKKDYHLLDSFVIYICAEGKVQITPENQEAVSLSKGETLLVPAMLKMISIVPDVESTILEVYVG
jgi:mannose-6-phosphate isomerase